MALPAPGPVARSPLAGFLLVLAATCVAYAIAPFGDLVWDDQLLVKQQMAAFRTLADVFAPPAGIANWSYYYYRPVVVLSYVVDEAWFGRGASMGPHAMNVLYQALTAVFVWLLARRLLRALPRGEAGALVAALFFAVHPLHTESVNWVTGRSDVLATLFLLPALLAILRWRDHGSIVALLGAFVFSLLAMMAKEVAITGVLLAPLLLGLAPAPPAAPPPTRAARWITWLGALVAFGGAAALYASLRMQAGSDVLGAEPGTLVEIGIRVLRAAGYYALKLFWPWPQVHFVPWSTVPQWPAALAVLGAGLALVAACFGWLRGAARALLVLALGWIAVTLAPAFAVVVTGVASTPVAERYLYLPSVGLALWAGLMWCRWREASASGRLPVITAALVLGALAAATLARGWVWASDLRLWSDAAGKIGDHAVPLIEVGKVRMLSGADQAAEEAFRRALEVADTGRLQATANYNIGTLLMNKGRVIEAEGWFDAARRADPTYAMGHLGKGRVLFEQGMREMRRGDAPQALVLFGRAEDEQLDALRRNALLAAAHLELARIGVARAGVQRSRGDEAAAGADLRAATAHMETAITLDPAAGRRPEVQQLARQAQILLQGLR